MSDLLLFLAVFLVVFGGHYLLGRFGPLWAGGVFPTLWVVLVVWLFFEGEMNSIADYLIAVLGFFSFLKMLKDLHEAREEKFQRENAKIDNTIIG